MPETGQGKEYTCADCGKVFTSGWSDDEAMAEMEATLVPVPGPLAVVCDDCYGHVMGRIRAEAPELLREAPGAS